MTGIANDVFNTKRKKEKTRPRSGLADSWSSADEVRGPNVGVDTQKRGKERIQ